ncbi:MAG TPA: hypothetical protein ENN72_05500 [Firmicutes bacterium]|nr:hypothetical protein [Bacillota bacterium]
MEIEIKDRKLAKRYHCKRKMEKEYGSKNAKMITQRINELQAIANLGLMMSSELGRCHKLTGNYKGLYGLALQEPFRMIIEPVFETQEDENKGRLNAVKKVIIRKIIDYH